MQCTSLTSIIIPQGVKVISAQAFSYCSALSSITIPEGVTSIDSMAFMGCTGLTGFTIPEGVTSIGNAAFMQCTGLTSITIPKNVTSIGDGPFNSCTSLVNITVDSNNSTYASIDGLLSNKEKNVLLQCPAGLTTIIIPESITNISNSAFRGCTGLTSITIPQGITSIGYEAFGSCTNLISITIPDSVASIGQFAFFNCTDLTSITIYSATTVICDSQYTIPETTKIIGFSPSTAQTYAAKYGRTFQALPPKKVTIAAQVGVIEAATESQSAVFAVTTENIANGKAVNISWVGTTQTTITPPVPPPEDSIGISASGTAVGATPTVTVTPTVTPTAAPIGISASGTAIANNSSTITVNGGSSSVAGTYYFKATIDGVSSEKVAVSVFAPETASSQAITIDATPKFINVPSSVTNSSIIANTSSGVNGNQQATLPAVQVSAATTLGTVQVSIPESTVVSGPTGWDGTIYLPAVQATNSVNVTPAPGYTSSVQAVLEVGYSDIKLVFDKAVRLLIPGQGDKLAAYSRGGVFTAIPKPTGAIDSQAWADSNIVQEGDAAIDVGSDLVIWTKHFTKFVSYAQTAIPNPGGGGGGGGGGTPPSAPGALVSASSGGLVSGSGATILIPANAINSDIRVNVAKVSDITNLATPSQGKIIGDVLEITKDKADNFSKAVTITLPFDQTKVDLAKYDIGVYWFDSTADKWLKLDNTTVDPAQGKVSGDVTHFSKFAVLATEKNIITPLITAPVINLSDIAGHWAESNIKTLVIDGAIGGYPDGSFKPDNTISRAEFAVVLVKAFKLEAKNNGKVFSDTVNHWAKDSIATANSFGIISGYNDNAFGPDNPVTREQMAAMIVKAAKIETTVSDISFCDVNQISAWAKSAVATATEKNIITGYPDNYFRPQGKANRAEAVTVIIKAMN